jgi:hypothetical protein
MKIKVNEVRKIMKKASGNCVNSIQHRAAHSFCRFSKYRTKSKQNTPWDMRVSSASGFKDHNCRAFHIVTSVQPTLTGRSALWQSLCNHHLSSLQPHSSEEGLQRRERYKNSEGEQLMKIKIRWIKVIVHSQNWTWRCLEVRQVQWPKFQPQVRICLRKFAHPKFLNLGSIN